MLSHASTRLLTYKNSTTLTRLISIFSQFKNQTKLSAFFTRINQNQSVNCLLYLFFFSFSMQLSIFGFRQKSDLLPYRRALFEPQSIKEWWAQMEMFSICFASLNKWSTHFRPNHLRDFGGLKWIFFPFVSLRSTSGRPILALITCVILVGSNGLEPSTSRLSGVCSNQLSYEPIFFVNL